jgi:tripartite-type tricarboxylate transporter receptor subunit TctC
VTGTVQLMISSVAASDAFVKAGKLRRIAISSERRFPGMEDLPTIGETLPGFVVDGWFAVVAPAATPAPIVARLNQGIVRFLEDPGVRQRILGFGLAPSGPGSPEATAKFIRTDQERWRGLVKELGIEPQ